MLCYNVSEVDECALSLPGLLWKNPPCTVFVKFVFQVPTVRFRPHGQKLCAGTFYIDMIAYEAERSVMALIHVIGRITTDLEMKYGESGAPYVRFGLAERIGYGDQARSQLYQVWAWKDTAEALIRSGLKKGSLVQLSGTLTLEEYTKSDGITTDKRLKVSLNQGSFIPVSKIGSIATSSPSTVEAIDGEKDPLPE